MKFTKNIDGRLSDEINSKSTKAFYDSVVNAIETDNVSVFATQLQIYITRIGLIVSECSLEKKMEKGYMLGAIQYLCIDVCHSRPLWHYLQAIDVNYQGNVGKHTLKDIDINIGECIGQYNKLINELIKQTGSKVLGKCKLRPKTTKKEKKIFKDNNVEQFGILNTKKTFTKREIKYSIKALGKYCVDKYNHIVQVGIVVKTENSYQCGSMRAGIKWAQNTQGIEGYFPIKKRNVGYSDETVILEIPQSMLKGNAVEVNCCVSAFESTAFSGYKLSNCEVSPNSHKLICYLDEEVNDTYYIKDVENKQNNNQGEKIDYYEKILNEFRKKESN
ncbi:MAG: hypothetical protein E7338_02790 [Clostridiales bacterium]|nr:hypothetical protein [Clostridiales bacterium]